MGKVLCLLYHRVIPYDEDVFGMKVRPEHFEEQMEYIVNNYEIIPFNSDWNKVDDNAIVITFDDGYMDNYINAYPILKKNKIPVTFFISTGNIGTSQEYWWDELQRLCFEREVENEYFNLNTEWLEYKFPSNDCEQLKDMMLSVRHILRREDDIVVWDKVYDDLYKWSGKNHIGRPCNFAMTEEQIYELSQDELVTIGGHTVSHRSLGPLRGKELYSECSNSINTLAQITKREISVFSYPFGGRGDYNDEVFDVLKACGIQKAATTVSHVYMGENSEYEIPRVTIKDNIQNWKEFIFKKINE